MDILSIYFIFLYNKTLRSDAHVQVPILVSLTAVLVFIDDFQWSGVNLFLYREKER
jgi:hypothetical protein